MYEKDLKALDGLHTDRFGDSIAGHSKPIIHKVYEPYTIAKVAIEMVEKWGPVAAVPDGEDSAGRQKLRMQTAAELAVRACETAAALWKEFEHRGWFFEMPLPIPRKEKESESA
jgi:hypothetical protein